MVALRRHHPPTPSSEEEGEQLSAAKAPSSSEEGVGGGGVVTRPLLLARAAEMRKNPTEPERRLWNALRDSRLAGHKFRRQAVIGRRIVDLFCPAKGLIIEIDGDTHDRELDTKRDHVMRRDFGYRTLRFTNGEVMTNIEGIQTVLLNVLNEQGSRWRA